jgi:hypothetical protein
MKTSDCPPVRAEQDLRARPDFGFREMRDVLSATPSPALFANGGRIAGAVPPRANIRAHNKHAVEFGPHRFVGEHG